MKQAAFDKPGQDYPHPGQLGMLSDATPYRECSPVRRGGDKSMLIVSKSGDDWIG